MGDYLSYLHPLLLQLFERYDRTRIAINSHMNYVIEVMLIWRGCYSEKVSCSSLEIGKVEEFFMLPSFD